MTLGNARLHGTHAALPFVMDDPDMQTEPIALGSTPELSPVPLRVRLPRPRRAADVFTGPLRVSDASLAAAAPHNPTAFGAIYRRYGDSLHTFCLGMLRDPDAAADCVQDVFCTAATRLHQLREHDKLRPWLYAIARHEALARLRSRRREQPAEVLPERATHDDGPEVLAARGELAALVADAASGLSDRDRAVLELHYRHGLDGPELADALGLSATNANTLVSRLRDTVRRCLGALLVARHQPERCAELAELLGAWDGAMTVLLRKRVNRHIEHCLGCREARDRLVSPRTLLASAPAVVPAPGWLSDALAREAPPLLQGEGGGLGVIAEAGMASWWPAGVSGGAPSATVLAPVLGAVVAIPAIVVAALLGAGVAGTAPVAAPSVAVPSTSSAAPPAPLSPRPSSRPGATTEPAPTTTPSRGAPSEPGSGGRPGVVPVDPGGSASPIPLGPMGPQKGMPAKPPPPEVVEPDQPDDPATPLPSEMTPTAPTTAGGPAN
ncbi:sigma-70 family RNA polymerase sigma factor [Actinomycetospora chibensis]|uniref:Sigma-70 family RNA polymerase sigma factor n=1 Tax=Actinomycetospora chibensis TaxID=663606 RepID=A0ABV9RKY6_9PSEU|nr:sigma-70 family RNA polymerase sigma factor [Actinomycetospora chibensis]MDD7927198.1 sigma-70 family RNA polymerase sigma factor [Actinomycetospora chibensis]